jgi:hypothetical protein
MKKQFLLWLFWFSLHPSVIKAQDTETSHTPPKIYYDGINDVFPEQYFPNIFAKFLNKEDMQKFTKDHPAFKTRLSHIENDSTSYYLLESADKKDDIRITPQVSGGAKIIIVTGHGMFIMIEKGVITLYSKKNDWFSVNKGTVHISGIKGIRNARDFCMKIFDQFIIDLFIDLYK